MRYIITIFFTSIVLISCIPDSSKQTIDDAMVEMQAMMADQDFKKALAFIELHKLRFGSYPTTIYDLQFLSGMDSSIMHSVEYVKLDSGYELNLKMRGMSITGEERALPLTYPEEFWQGLGCVESNTKR